MHTSRSASRAARALGVSLLSLALLLAGALPGAAQPTPSTLATVAGDVGAGWVARQVAADGAVQQGFSGPVGNAIQAALSLAAAEDGDAAFDRAVAYVEAGFEEYVADADGNDKPGALAYVILMADAAGLDPTTFGDAETNLIERLQATRRTSGTDAGLYGSQDPSFDGAFRQSLALLALDSADVAPDDTAVQWLVDLQCDSGGWPAYRPQRTVDVCDPATANPDSNSTALAVQALDALGVASEYDPRAYLTSIQEEDGGFAFTPGFGTDSNSTALVIQAIVALGEDPSAGRWIDQEQDSPVTALLRLQIGCNGEEADRGAFAYQPGEDGSLAANAATMQAVWGVQQLPLPFGPRAVAATTPTVDCSPLDVARRQGATRVATAVEISRAAYPDGADTVVLAYAYDFADALSGGPLARSEDAPLLLTDRDGLDAEVAAEIERLGATRAILLGGPAALSQQVADDLEADTPVSEVERIDGVNRFDTAAKIAARLGGDAVYVTEGQDSDPARGWPDALAVSALASFQERPILLVTTEQLPPETRAALAGKDSATIVGGEAAVSAQVAAAVDEEVGTVARVAGDTRYETALAVSRLARAAGMSPTTSWFATGNAFADALAAGPAAAKAGHLLMLVDGIELGRSAATVDYLREIDLVSDAFRIAGGDAAVSPSVVDAMVDQVR